MDTNVDYEVALAEFMKALDLGNLDLGMNIVLDLENFANGSFEVMHDKFEFCNDLVHLFKASNDKLLFMSHLFEANKKKVISLLQEELVLFDDDKQVLLPDYSNIENLLIIAAGGEAENQVEFLKFYLKNAPNVTKLQKHIIINMISTAKLCGDSSFEEIAITLEEQLGLLVISNLIEDKELALDIMLLCQERNNEIYVA